MGWDKLEIIFLLFKDPTTPLRGLNYSHSSMYGETGCSDSTPSIPSKIVPPPGYAMKTNVSLDKTHSMGEWDKGNHPSRRGIRKSYSYNIRRNYIEKEEVVISAQGNICISATNLNEEDETQCTPRKLYIPHQLLVSSQKVRNNETYDNEHTSDVSMNRCTNSKPEANAEREICSTRQRHELSISEEIDEECRSSGSDISPEYSIHYFDKNTNLDNTDDFNNEDLITDHRNEQPMHLPIPSSGEDVTIGCIGGVENDDSSSTGEECTHIDTVETPTTRIAEKAEPENMSITKSEKEGVRDDKYRHTISKTMKMVYAHGNRHLKCTPKYGKIWCWICLVNLICFMAGVGLCFFIIFHSKGKRNI